MQHMQGRQFAEFHVVFGRHRHSPLWHWLAGRPAGQCQSSLCGQGAAGITAAAGVVEITSTMRREKPGESKGMLQWVGGRWVANQRGQIRCQSRTGQTTLAYAGCSNGAHSPTPNASAAVRLCNPADRPPATGKTNPCRQTKAGAPWTGTSIVVCLLVHGASQFFHFNWGME